MKKRVFDVALVALAAVVWVPVLALASFAVLVLSGRPVYYRSMRWVRTGEIVRVVKFRTMVRDAEKIANRATVPITTQRFLNIPPDSPLYTRIGRVLEKLGLTEIPQLLHVIRGEMSIVGNRPLPDSVMQCLRDDFPYAEDRFLTRAGLTGPAQLVGRQALTDSERLRLEGAYCRAALHGYTWRLDFMILLRTVLIIAHVTPSLDYQGALDMIERLSSRRSRGLVIEPMTPPVAAEVDAPLVD